MRLTDEITKKVIVKLLTGQDYRIEIISLLDAEFLQYTIDFFKKVVEAKLNDKQVTINWYKEEFLNPNKLPTEEIIINSGLNKKTISNMYNTAKKEIALNASTTHYETLYKAINELIENNNEINITLTIKFRDVSVDLNINESLIIINSLAVKRSAIRGGLWSTAGKRVEKHLMKAICYLFDVPKKHFDQSNIEKSFRETDFYLIDGNGKLNKCEVKLMGKGNPESADAVIARDSQIFVADKLSDLNKIQLDKLGVYWIELRAKEGYKKATKIFKALKIPHKNIKINVKQKLNKVFTKIF